MIQSFKHKGLKKLFFEGDTSKLPSQHVERIENMVFVLDMAETLDMLRIPAYRLHALKGDLKGFYSMRVSGNLRMIFRFENGDAWDVDLIDYH